MHIDRKGCHRVYGTQDRGVAEYPLVPPLGDTGGAIEREMDLRANISYLDRRVRDHDDQANEAVLPRRDRMEYVADREMRNNCPRSRIRSGNRPAQASQSVIFKLVRPTRERQSCAARLYRQSVATYQCGAYQCVPPKRTNGANSGQNPLPSQCAIHCSKVPGRRFGGNASVSAVH